MTGTTQTHFSGKRVLVADDSTTIRQIMRKELNRMGFLDANIHEFKNGELALRALEKEPTDLIISDWNMPDFDGLDLLKAVRNNPNLSPIPFLMVTSETEEKKKMEAFESGADQYVTKPFKPATLDSVIGHLLNKDGKFQEKHILIIDDSSTLRSIIKKTLTQVGFSPANLAEAEDGQVALKLIEKQVFHMVITDWHMPNIDGLEFIKSIRSKPAFKHLPVFMVTTESDKAKVIEALKSGLNGYILKPFNSAELQEKIETFFEKH